jgi:Response regulators consisting of a CheY-like receiver domain and a winged-helix DNA-binding domain|nr:response regulator [uncultured Steroidobacter sp.]
MPTWDRSRLRSGTHAPDNKRVLIVDDSLEARELHSQLLRRQGYEVDLAMDGVDGWHALHSGHFDLVLADADMPLMDGLKLISRIRKDPRLQELSVLIALERDSESDRRRGFEAGADYYVIKSAAPETLVKAVAGLIGSAQT